MSPVIQLATALAIALVGYFVFAYRSDGWMPTRENLSTSLHKLKNEMTVETRAPFDAQPVWYAGMVVEPAEFAQQLANLQLSLQRANAPVVRHAEARQTVAQ